MIRFLSKDGNKPQSCLTHAIMKKSRMALEGVMAEDRRPMIRLINEGLVVNRDKFDGEEVAYQNIICFNFV